MISSKRQRILEGMLEAVGDEGYARASVRSVLDRTGLYRQAFYNHFADKDDCYLQAYDLGVWQVDARVRAAAEDAPSWRAGLRSGLGAMLDFLEAEPDVGRALLVEVFAAGPTAVAKREAALRQFGAYLDQARNDGGGTPPAVTAEAVAAGMDTVLHARLAAHEDDRLGCLLPDFMYIAVLPYFGAEAASVEMYGGAN